MSSGSGLTGNQLLKGLSISLQNAAKLNPILCHDESAREEMIHYLTMALDFYNTHSPFDCYTFQNFPSYSWIIHRAVIEAMVAKGILQDRNEQHIVIYGEQIEDFGKGDKFYKWAQSLIDSNMEHLDQLKRGINIGKAFGISDSMYSADPDGFFSQ